MLSWNQSGKTCPRVRFDFEVTNLDCWDLQGRNLLTNRVTWPDLADVFRAIGVLDEDVSNKNDGDGHPNDQGE